MVTPSDLTHLNVRHFSFTHSIISSIASFFLEEYTVNIGISWVFLELVFTLLEHLVSEWKEWTSLIPMTQCKHRSLMQENVKAIRWS